MSVLNKFDTKIYGSSVKKNVFNLTITNIHHYETDKNDSNTLNSSAFAAYEDSEKTGDEIDFVGNPGENSGHIKAIRGIRYDLRGNSLGNIFVPVKHAGHVPHINIADNALIQVFDDGNKGMYVGSSHSKKTTWLRALEVFDKPVPSTLEMRGSTGDLYTYNPVYITYHPKYVPTELYFGDDADKIWYERFVLFDSSDIYRNKRNFIDYNPWLKDTFDKYKDRGTDDLQTARTSGAEHVLKLVENPSDLYYMNRFFYLKNKNYPFRPDPVFDVNSPFHQSKDDSAVVRTQDGVDLGLADLSKDVLDVYPVTHTHLDISESKLLKTAYDETINSFLSNIRTAATPKPDTLKLLLNSKDEFEPDVANADVPFEFKESREIRIGRNKLFMADVYGNQNQLFSTFKTAKDQGLTMIYHNDAAEISQVRLRGNLGESILLESRAKSNDFSRINLKGVSGQIFEMVDSKEGQKNFIHMVTSYKEFISPEWGLTDATYLMLGNNSVIDSEKRLSNNPVIAHYDGRAGTSGRYTVRGAYEDKIHHAYNALLVDESKQAYTENWTNYNSGTWVHDVRRGLSGDANGFHRAQKPGKFVQYTYSAGDERWQLHNTLHTNIEINKKDVIIRTASGGNAQVWAPGGVIDVRGTSKVDVGSGSVVNLVAPRVNLGSTSPEKLVVRDQDPCTVNIRIPAALVFAVVYGGAPFIELTASGNVTATPGSAYITNGSSVSAQIQEEYNLEGGGI